MTARARNLAHVDKPHVPAVRQSPTDIPSTLQSEIGAYSELRFLLSGSTAIRIAGNGRAIAPKCPDEAIQILSDLPARRQIASARAALEQADTDPDANRILAFLAALRGGDDSEKERSRRVALVYQIVDEARIRRWRHLAIIAGVDTSTKTTAFFPSFAEVEPKIKSAARLIRKSPDYLDAIIATRVSAAFLLRDEQAVSQRAITELVKSGDLPPPAAEDEIWF